MNSISILHQIHMSIYDINITLYSGAYNIYLTVYPLGEKKRGVHSTELGQRKVHSERCNTVLCPLYPLLSPILNCLCLQQSVHSGKEKIFFKCKAGLVGARPWAWRVPPAARVFSVHPGVCLGQWEGWPPASLLAMGGGHQPRHGLRMGSYGDRQLAPAGRSGRRNPHEKSGGGGQSLLAAELASQMARLPSRRGDKWRRKGRRLWDGQHRAAQPNRRARRPHTAILHGLSGEHLQLDVGRAARASTSSEQHHPHSCVKRPVFKNVSFWSSGRYIFAL